MIDYLLNKFDYIELKQSQRDQDQDGFGDLCDNCPSVR